MDNYQTYCQIIVVCAQTRGECNANINIIAPRTAVNSRNPVVKYNGRFHTFRPVVEEVSYVELCCVCVIYTERPPVHATVCLHSLPGVQILQSDNQPLVAKWVEMALVVCCYVTLTVIELLAGVT